MNNPKTFTFGYEFDFQQGNSFDGVLDMYVAVSLLKSISDSGTTMKFTITYNPVCDAEGEEKFKSQVTKNYLQWIANAGEMAAKSTVKYELNTDTEVPVEFYVWMMVK